MPANQPNRKIKSIERTTRILNLIRQGDAMTVTSIADEMELSVGSVHTYLSTLEAVGFVVRGDQGYNLGPEFIPLGEYVRNQSRLYKAGWKEIDKLAEKTDEAVHLLIEHQGRGIALYEQFGEEAAGTEYHRKVRQEAHQNLHCTASGKAILAHLPEPRVSQIIDDQSLTAQTQQTITDPHVLLEELATIRERGYAINDEEEVRGVVAVGSAVRDTDGTVLGSIAVSVPKTRMEQGDFKQDLVDMIQRAVNVCEINLETEEDTVA